MAGFSMLLPADPKAGFLAHEAEIRGAIDRVLASGHYILGPEVAAFEQAFAAYLGGGHCAGVADGTEAIELALRAVGVAPGDRVATVGNTVSATIAAVQQIGAVPVYVEIDPSTMVMCPVALSRVLAAEGGRIKAVLPVHLYGYPADMPAISAAAVAHGAVVVEDCAQAHGARIDGRAVGTWGAAAAFSFYPTKNLGALGDGGGVFSRDQAVIERVRLLRQYGWKTRYWSEVAGRNSRLDELQAAILRVKLTHLDAENARRRALAARYHERLAGTALRLPTTRVGHVGVVHQFAVRTPRREALKTCLLEQGIACGVLYPFPVYKQPAYAAPSVALPVTERACEEVLCLPCHPGITGTDVDRVSDAILHWERSS